MSQVSKKVLTLRSKSQIGPNKDIRSTRAQKLQVYATAKNIISSSIHDKTLKKY